MQNFISKIKFRLNAGIALKAILISLIVAAVFTIIWGLTYILRGHAVAASIVYPAAAGITVITALIIWLANKKDNLQSAVYADKFFDLKDSVSSALEFEQNKKEGQIYDLQRKQAVAKLDDLSAKSIPFPVSNKLSIAAAVGVIAAGSLSLATPSNEVLNALKEKERMLQRSEEIKAFMDDEVEKMIKSLSDDEQEIIDPNAIRQWVKELKKTDDKREALRNIARIEQKLKKAVNLLENRKNEEMLKTAGMKMLTAKDLKIKEIGAKLKNKEFKKASEKLNEFKLNNKKDLDAKLAKIKNKPPKASKKETLKEKQEKVAKLRELTKRLSQAANQSRSSSSSSQSQSMSMKQFSEMLSEMGLEQVGKQTTLQDLKNLLKLLSKKQLDQLPPELLKKLTRKQLDQLPPELLKKLLELLDKNAKALQDAMADMDLEMQEGREMTDEEMKELLKLLQEMDGDLESLMKMLKRMEAAKNMRGKLKGLKMKLNGLGLGRVPSSGKGGKLPGVGSDGTRRNNKDKLLNNGKNTKIKGIKGVGPVKSSIEEADSGEGTSNLRGSAKKRSFEHLMSSFIEREDVSEEMKQGVKKYFENIHNIQQSNTTEKSK